MEDAVIETRGIAKSFPGVQALDDVGYHGWAITEQGGGDTPDGLKDLAARLGKILAL